MWYRTGLVNVTNNSTAVVGVGTSWITGASVGEVFVGPDGKTYEIADILSATSLTLGSVYLGSTISGQTYQIIPTQSYMRDLASEVSELVSNYGTAMTNAGVGKFGDGTLALPGVAFTADTNTGLHRTGSDAFSAVAGGSAAASFTASGTELKAGSTVNSVPIAGTTTTQTLTNKTIDLTSNTLVATSAQLKAALTDETGSGSAVFATSPTLVTPVLGTPASGTLTNCTGLPVATGISGLGTGVATFLATPSSANFSAALTDESGTGAFALTASPIFTGIPSAPTPVANAISGQIANAEFVQREKEIVSGKSQILHQGTIVASCIDLPSKHSDGGAWIDRCSDKSWYNETLGGDRWIGWQATIADAWTAAGSATGAVFGASATAGPLTIGKFYTATSATTATEVFRGIKREYPRAGVAWIAESARVVGYDLGSGAMWRVITSGASRPLYATISSIAAAPGVVLVGMNTGNGAVRFDFAADEMFNHYTGTTYNAIIPGGIAASNSTATYRPSTKYGAIVNNTVNSVAITVLPNAPIDPATGLPVPTIAVATVGGVSVIKDDGTVVNSSSTASAKAVRMENNRLYVLRGASLELLYSVANLSTLGSSFAMPTYYGVDAGSLNIKNTAGISALTTGATIGVPTSAGVSLISENPTTPASGMVAYVTEKYNSGWQVGAIKGAYLADSVAETVTGVTPLSDDFSGYVDTAAMLVNWSDATLTDATPTLASGKLRLTRDTANTAAAVVRSFTTVAGKQYVLALGISGDAGYYFIRVGTTALGYDLLSPGATALTTSNLTYTFTATGTTTYLSLFVYTGTAGQYIDFDNISVKLAEPDRSVKGKGLIVNGSLTKTAVASGAGLVCYGGFAA